MNLVAVADGGNDCHSEPAIAGEESAFSRRLSLITRHCFS
jgi:hypothetical protein